MKNADSSMAAGSPGYAAGTVVTKTTYDAMGQPVSQTDANGLSISLTRNLLGDVTEVAYMDGSTRRYDRDYTNNTLLYINEIGAQLLYKYCSSRNMEECVVDVQSGAVLQYRRYDELRRLEEEGDPYSRTAYVYDASSKLIQKTTEDSQGAIIAQESYAYNEVYNSGAQKRVQKTIVGESGAPSIISAIWP